MKNVEKHLDELLENTDEFNCTCCRLRLGHCPDCDNMTNVECEEYKELNKQWLKAEYVPKEAIYILRSINQKFEYICKSKNQIILFNNLLKKRGIIGSEVLRFDEVCLSNIFDYMLFDFLPLDTNIPIDDILKQYKDIY